MTVFISLVEQSVLAINHVAKLRKKWKNTHNCPKFGQNCIATFVNISEIGVN
jgi:hypothetical protein